MSVLAGLRVVEMGLWVAGPAAGGIMADWGAEVWKIETPSGDPMRQLFRAISGSKEDKCPPFDLYNRGKRSVALDMKTDEGMKVAQEIIATADVFLTNMRPQYLDRCGLGSERLTGLYPRLVYASLTGYGATGPEKDAPGFDVAAFSARSGVAYRATPEGSAPPILPGGMGDNVTAMVTVAGILGALYNREKTGAGQLVSTSLLRTGIYSIGMDVSTRLGLGRLAPTPSRTTPQNPLMNPYRAGDGRWLWLIGAEAERHWPGIAKALDDPRLGDEEVFGTPRLRRRNAEALVGIFDEVFSRRSRDEWAAIFRDEDVWWSPVNSVEDLLTDAQVIAAGSFVDVPTGTDGETEQGLATPVEFGADPAGPAGSVPAIGADTDDILSAIGLGADRIAALRSSGVIR